MINNRSRPPQALTWADLPHYAAILSATSEAMDQCSLRNAGRELAFLFLLRESLSGFCDIQFTTDLEPDDELLLAIGRIIAAHKRGCATGRIIG